MDVAGPFAMVVRGLSDLERKELKASSATRLPPSQPSAATNPRRRSNRGRELSASIAEACTKAKWRSARSSGGPELVEINQTRRAGGARRPLQHMEPPDGGSHIPGFMNPPRS